jgi:hypothetical protein
MNNIQKIKEFEGKWCKEGSGFLGAMCHIDDVVELSEVLLLNQRKEIIEGVKKKVEDLSIGVKRNPSGLRTDTVWDDIEDARESGYLGAIRNVIALLESNK